MIELKVIGSGSAFDVTYTNSSFLIKLTYNDNSRTILFDCGYNVFPKLVKYYQNELKDIEAVFISHMDDDHVGSLKSLIYYRYFVYKKPTVVITGQDVYNDIYNYLKDINKKNANVCKIYKTFGDDFLYNKLNYNFIFKFIKNIHHIPSYGFIVFDKNENVGIYITGDSKADLRKEKYTKEFENVYIFHDFSFIDNPSITHASFSDMKTEYSKHFLKKTFLYHNEISAKILEDRIFMFKNSSFESNISQKELKKINAFNVVY